MNIKNQTILILALGIGINFSAQARSNMGFFQSGGHSSTFTPGSFSSLTAQSFSGVAGVRNGLVLQSFSGGTTSVSSIFTGNPSFVNQGSGPNFQFAGSGNSFNSSFNTTIVNNYINIYYNQTFNFNNVSFNNSPIINGRGNNVVYHGHHPYTPSSPDGSA
ncbi:hypothetical protein [Candidatus Nitrosacidococcus sp. I8]|uniref:hypothetical protein n=1 Tax=Candidatus Nitrosacidococcus sp. I8 TaxID=2942908 RepID=UPI002226C350|nr:hypothetical protein [Candidatus Nitrosacidococcus sp. I8]CAH9018325.1 hypothetical protein NURINAE_00861 [Candidatus Nitrosacidococcus sp. I8]